MKSIRIGFLADVLSLQISEWHQLMIANEYYSATSKPLMATNNEDGLEDMCCGMSVDEILRASHYGNYVYTDKYVFINEHGNFETTNDICDEWRDIAEWMIDSGYKTAFDAWNILNNCGYVDDGRFQEDFLDEFPYRIDADAELVENWFEYADYTLSYLFLKSWDGLKDEFNEWVKEQKD